ncbi:zinc finger CCCH domain-containing protein 56-like [Euphorbia lathyris]|uniref:zinc finger CCCH domain-containing protein 56-like n=1 Tax=Euphorbia lathyris TaxID=212925 RepID=UPI00331445A4
MNSSIDTVESGVSFSVLLECAADNDVEGFKRLVCDESEIRAVSLWYSHQRVSKKRVLEHRTPLMIAAKYGSVDVVKLILALPEIDVNFSCGPDKSTALHCAASGGSTNAVDVVKLLLLAGADPGISDANCHIPGDVIVASPNFPHLKIVLEELLKNSGSLYQWDRSSSPPISLSSEEGSLSPVSGSVLSPVTSKTNDSHVQSANKKEYPVDPSLPDIKNSIYTTDEFRMFAFKIQPCSRAYSHDWTECPFVHPGENARRRDPRRFQYSCVPCPDHRKGACRRGDFCEYSHGIFECWLHPAQYRTRLCKDGTNCIRRVCFFAHTPEELRPVYPSTAAMSSPHALAGMDFASAMNVLLGSPSAPSSLSYFPFTPPMSPSSNDPHSPMAWHQQNISNLQTAGNNLQASRLRNSLNARDFPSEERYGFQDYELQQLHLLNELSYVSGPQQNTSSANLSAHLNHQLNLSNLDRFLSSDVSSPRNTDQLGAASVFSSSYKSAALNQFQQQSMLSPIKTGVSSPKTAEYPQMQVSFDSSSPRINEPISPSILQRQFGNLSSREAGSNFKYNLVISSENPWVKKQHPFENADCSVQADEVDHQTHKSYLNKHSGEEPDVSWVQSVLKESPPEPEECPSRQDESSEHIALRAWLEGLQLDQIVA